jgi:hypothetical protein
MGAVAKLCLLFATGVTVGLVVPWGFGPSKPASSDEAGRRPLAVRCVVEYANDPAGKRPRLPRRLPLPEDEGVRRPISPVEVVVQPTGQKTPDGADEVIVIFRLNTCACHPEADGAPVERPMPGAT